MKTPWYEKTAKEIRDAVHQGEASALDIVNSFIEHADAVDGTVGAYTQRWSETARTAAQRIDEKIRKGLPAGALAGVPVALKESICTSEGKTTGASKMLADYRSPFDATAVTRLQQADAVFLGKVNMDELGLGSSTETSALQRTTNPWAPDRVPGGSSGGSAAAVASGTCALALGTDTGSSIRQPASFCGCIGFKPTYGRISRLGIIGIASSLDHVGPLARTVEDTALALNVLCGEDKGDPTSSDRPVPDFTRSLGRDIRGLRIGVPKEYLASDLDAEVRQYVEKALDQFRNAGAEIVSISLPCTGYDAAAYTVISTAEMSAGLARLDGVRYGARHPEAKSVPDVYVMSKSAGLGTEVQRRIILGTYFLSGKNRQDYFVKAQQVRTVVKKDFQNAFEQCDIIAGATTATAAFPFGSKSDNPLEMYACDQFTVAANLASHPALSIPCGKTAAGLPIGLHLQARSYDEETLLGAAFYYEQHRGFEMGFPSIL
ncbi:MAG TPA: Asp-tRNA(Asn)/Glu-tRNA(Gln) amidotransferase subunit GatA [Candidatus Hydrogenedentes bacterium]|jgi:aspartyl-tRNA(Asn)/glutamyl-tRNA(Gln) amidotransferase subunit A|nr:Asp-tRNA(Asn)/Glu-tRNA(Gln) amidotransferase subunit GatA [Candidatus Hydrogenedentota bacterium]HOD94546.1 Asp-tRNA(Asn)/Glu-tRNA(Gln) amidotransferase subunit GatA [Candidatus Hydrogenedentota bacterium]HOH42196.1 Asp-tRNA(Asn)/Glu-tRNA(Gln) amidotransferase subunit GatA [Candidatus Hydrogenedentota bacterium]HOR49922.1 Asp-tRNA(Asn)/Glu-tRNA(Gln) amidotransferase subunit GatA [Candidatus Hydrogenedentota bacterium]HPK23905.1 Asp-tRNA(Asn)/Glu-tRNA(Gln) amidotransferase subunit GatA [Candi